jgi:hypothetical protein
MGIVATELVAEFGAYAKTKNTDIFEEILKPANIDKHCTSKRGIVGVYEMARAETAEVSQAFQKAWTPKGSVTFKPSSIVMRRCKIDFEMDVDDIYNGWLTFLAEEGKNRTDWPITRYVVEKLANKAKEERGLTSIDGTFVAPTAGTAGARINMFDGFATLLSAIDTAGTGNEIVTGSLATTPYSKVRDFIRGFAPEAFTACGRKVFMSTAMVDAVYDDFEDTNPNKTLKEVGGDDYGYIIPGTQGGKIIGVDGLGASERLWATPIWNQLKLSDQIDEVGNIEIQLDKRQVILLADYAAAYGFGFPNFVWHNDVV